jgi:uncharacterized membrane protein
MTGAFTFPDSNAVATVALLLRRLRARVTTATVRDTLLRHPDYPSLLSLSDVLDSWKVDNMALQFDTVEQLRELPLPFVAHLNMKGGWYVLVTEIGKDFLTYIDTKRGTVREKTADFTKKWTKVVLLAETDEQSGEADYEKNHQTERLTTARQLLIGVAAVILFGFGLWRVAPTATILFWGLLLTKLLGTLTTGLLLVHQINSQNALVNRICKLGQTGGCSGILDSPAAKLTSWLSWSEIGFFYFSGGLLALFFTGPNQLTLTVLAGLATLALPYTVYSLVYQARIAKTWCMLCLMVQVLFVAEFLITLPVWPLRLPAETLPTAFTVGISLLFPAVVYAVLSPLLRAARQGQRDRISLNRLKYNPAVFRFLLERQPKMPDWLPSQTVRLGNLNALHTITVVTNPFCGACAIMHNDLKPFLHSDTLAVQFIFEACQHHDKASRQVVTHFLALHRENRLTDAIDDWFTRPVKQYGAWAKQWPVGVDLSEFEGVMKESCFWCFKAGIGQTPTVFLDNHRLPNEYHVSDLQVVLPIVQSVFVEDLAKSS